MVSDRTTLSLGPLLPGPADPAEPVAVGLTLMWHPAVERVGDRLPFSDDAVLISRLEPDFLSVDGRSTGPLGDPYVSRSPLVFTRVEQGYRVEGRARIDGRPLDGARRVSSAEIDRGVTIELASRIVLLLHRLPIIHRADADGLGLVGDSVAMRRLRRDIEVAASSEAAVLIHGETGVGKELVARALHRRSERSAAPYLAVNVAAIPPPVAASAFFGHVRGAFSGAEQGRPGYFASAATGTLFLDEIGALPGDMQPMLLRALQSNEIQPVGGQGPIRTDVRIIAATDADLKTTPFSRPLLYRLGQIELEVPPLRHRREDITRLLVWSLRQELGLLGAVDRLDEQKKQQHLWLDASVIGLLCRYSWPGNVRELLSIAHQIALVGRRRAQVRPDHIKALDRISQRLAGAAEDATAVATAAAPSDGSAPHPESAAESPVTGSGSAGQGPASGADELTRAAVADALRHARWSVSSAARSLGIARTTVYRWAKKHGLARTSADVSDADVRAAWHAAEGNLDAMCDILRLSKHSLMPRLNALDLMPVSSDPMVGPD